MSYFITASSAILAFGHLLLTFNITIKTSFLFFFARAIRQAPAPFVYPVFIPIIYGSSANNLLLEWILYFTFVLIAIHEYFSSFTIALNVLFLIEYSVHLSKSLAVLE